jgi:hypothetical protein
MPQFLLVERKYPPFRRGDLLYTVQKIRRKALLPKDLRRFFAAKFDVSAYVVTTYIKSKRKTCAKLYFETLQHCKEIF